MRPDLFRRHPHIMWGLQIPECFHFAVSGSGPYKFIRFYPARANALSRAAEKPGHWMNCASSTSVRGFGGPDLCS